MMNGTLENRTYICASKVFTGVTTDDVIDDAAIVISDGLIVGIEKQVAIREELAHSANVVDYGDCTIVPGFVDTHAHLTLSADLRSYEEMAAEPDEMLALVGVSNLERHIGSGVTTMRDNGGRNKVVFWVREAARRGYIRAPRLLLAGRPVTHSAGHFHWANGVADGADAIRATVRELVAEGADHIKIMASGGGTGGNTPYLASYQADELAVAVETAHSLKVPTTAHCRAASSMINALDAGMDCIEHGEFLIDAPMVDYGHGIAGTGTMQYDPAITKRMVDTGTFLSFTMQTGGYDTLFRLRKKRESGEKISKVEKARINALESYYEMKLDVFASLVNDGMEELMSLSSDAGPFDCEFGRMHWNMELAVDAGMTPAQAIRATTSVAAKLARVDDLVGSLERGKSADIVVIEGDPLSDIKRISEVRAVYLEGEFIGPVEPRITRDFWLPRTV